MIDTRKWSSGGRVRCSRTAIRAHNGAVLLDNIAPGFGGPMVMTADPPSIGRGVPPRAAARHPKAAAGPRHRAGATRTPGPAHGAARGPRERACHRPIAVADAAPRIFRTDLMGTQQGGSIFLFKTQRCTSGKGVLRKLTWGGVVRGNAEVGRQRGTYSTRARRRKPATESRSRRKLPNILHQ